MNNINTLIVAASGTSQYAESISQTLGIPWIEIETSKFPNEELRIRIQQAADTTILLGSLSKPVNNRIIEYVLAADAIKRLGCKKLVGVLSWYAYSKQDKVFLEGEPLSAKVIASMLQDVSIQELYTLDLHNPSIRDYFTIPVTNMSAGSLFIDFFKSTDLSNTVVVSPDAGSVKNSSLIAQSLKIPMIHASKKRDLYSGRVEITGIDGDVTGKNVLIFDDMIATGSTLIEIGNFLHLQGALNITVSATHHLYVDDAQKKLETSRIDKIIVTNSITGPQAVPSAKLSILDVSPVIAAYLSQYKYLPT